MEVSGQLQAPAVLAPGAFWLRYWVELAKRKKIPSSIPSGIETPFVQPVTYSLCWLWYNGSMCDISVVAYSEKKL